MAGTNKILKPGQVLFKAGDPSDGMYVIRKGSLRVYLEKDGKEVQLASVGDGGIIGEMAFFDHLPRSASVKALSEVEVSVISNDEFSKLLKQIPKWFVTLMQALSTRLRQTNERLKTLEGTTPKKTKPFQTVIRILHVFNLLYHKDGTKEGKDWLIEKESTVKTLTVVFGEEPDKVAALFDVLTQQKLLLVKNNTYGRPVLNLANKSALTKLTETLVMFVEQNPQQPYLPDPAMDMLKMLGRIVEQSPYETVTVSLDDLDTEGKRQQLQTTAWKDQLTLFKTIGDGVALVKTSNGQVGIRASKKDLPALLLHHAIINSFFKAGLL